MGFFNHTDDVQPGSTPMRSRFPEQRLNGGAVGSSDNGNVRALRIHRRLSWRWQLDLDLTTHSGIVNLRVSNDTAPTQPMHC
jgi:hypothetical protein